MLNISSKTRVCFFILGALISFSCGKNYDNSAGAVSAFIIAAEQHDMSKAWNLLGPEAQSFYNDLGEKERRSGKGALEHEVNNIKVFRSLKKDYKISMDKENKDLVKVILFGGAEFPAITINDNGAYKIKDGESVRNILKGITYELNQKEGY